MTTPTSSTIRFPRLLGCVLLAAVLVGCGSEGAAKTAAVLPTASIAPTQPTDVATATTGTPASTIGAVTGLPTGVPGDLPNGVYRAEITDADLDAVNVSPKDWQENHGTFTWTLNEGNWSFVQLADNPIQAPSGQGVYLVDGDRVSFLVANDLGPQDFTWSLSSDGSLVLTALPSTGSYFAAYLAAHPLVRVAP